MPDRRERVVHLGLTLSLVLWRREVNGSLMIDAHMEALMGYPPHTFPGTFEAFIAHVHPEDRPRLTQALQVAFARRQPHWSIEYRIEGPDGPSRMLAAQGRIFYNEAGNPLRTVGMAWDITERRTRELQDRLSQKMASIGHLAAGMAHEINTPLQYLGDNLSFLTQSTEPLLSCLRIQRQLESATSAGESTHELWDDARALMGRMDADFLITEVPLALAQATEGVTRIHAIVSAMRDLSHPDTDSMVQVDINQIIRSSLTVTRGQYREWADMVTDLAPDLPLVPCHPGALSQVFINLIINAAQALTESFPTKGRGSITIISRRDGGSIEIRFQDTAAGIPVGIRHMIFDPFFTTKPVGTGTGQGLAIVHAIVVSKHHGSIDVSSEIGQGSEFRIRLPMDLEVDRQAS